VARILRPYQVDALAGVRETLKTYASCVCVLPTGMGKTTVAATLMNEWEGGNCLFLAHTRELVDQAANRLAGELGYRPTVEMGIRGGDEGLFYQGGMVVVGSVQSMLTDRRLAKYERHPFDLIVID
jgi:superfamily II DNA or RNA helicase